MGDYVIYDTHCHLTDEKFDFDRDKIIENLQSNSVVKAMLPSDNVENSIKAIDLSGKYDFLYNAVGIHPEENSRFTDEDISRIEELADNTKCKAIGEIGLDYHYEHDKQKQKYLFEKQMQIAERKNLPVIIHTRDAIQDTYDILKKYPNVRGIMHSYSGSYEMAMKFIDLGYYISFSGVVTFKNARNVKETCEKLPIDKILVETDSPYLTPHPYRGKRNEPKYVNLVLQEVSLLKKMSEKEAAQIICNNADDIFGW